MALAASNLAFRGHTEKTDQPNSGNVLVTIDLLSKYDRFLQEIISGPKNRGTYLYVFQNELVQLFSKNFENIIFKQI